MKKSTRLIAALVAALGFIATGASAQGFPDHSIHFYVGQGPGGSTDVVARLVAQQMSETLKQSVIVENRTGNAGSIAADFVSRAKPDGYSVLVVSSSYSINPFISKLSFDPQKSLTPVSLLAEAPFVLVARKSFEANNVGELLKLADARPNGITYASGGVGSSGHLAGALLAVMSNKKLTHVPYRGAGPALIDVQAGVSDILFASVLSATPLLKGGELKVLGVSSASRSPVLPGVPTVAESGVPGYSDTSWYALLVPPGTPVDIINKLSAAAKLAVDSPSVSSLLKADGAIPVGSSPAEFEKFLGAQLAKWSDLIKRTGIHAGAD
jgi:tripartite-type tricarboxylate transporter receptor subunit TctC